jgi:hypothetical protein
VKICGSHAHTSTTLALMMIASSVTACAISPTPSTEISDQLTVEAMLIQPLQSGADGFDHVTRMLRARFPMNNQAPVTDQIKRQKPLKLRDGYIILRYLQLDGRHALVEIDSSPCFPVEKAIAVTHPDPSRLDQSRNSGIYLATGSGMSVGFSSTDAKRVCVTALEIAETPRR